MTKIVLALGPSGLAPHRFDPGSFSLTPVDSGEAETILCPGFVDIHTHGAFGIDFMAARRAEIVEWCDRLAEIGYEGFLPTTVTAPVEDVRRALGELPEHPMIWGFHLEGPFISPKYPGAQPQEFIIEPPVGPSEWDSILADPRLKVVTLAPERPGGLELTRRLADRDVRVSMGHTEATFEQCTAAFAAGARHTTHTFNAMRPLHHREAGTVGFAMATDSLFAELIYDRHHVSPPAASVLLRCKSADRVIAISDSTMAAGMPSGTTVTMWGLEGFVNEGTVRLADGTLAGSAATLYDVFRNLLADFGAEVAIRACSLTPRTALGVYGPPRVYIETTLNGEIVARHAR